MANPVSVLDLQNRWRPLTDEEIPIAQALLDDAWEIMLARVPGIESRITSGDLRPGLVVKIACEAVKPVMQNPEGFMQEAIEDWQGRRDATTSTGKLILTDDDLRPLFGGIVRKSFSIVPDWA